MKIIFDIPVIFSTVQPIVGAENFFANIIMNSTSNDILPEGSRMTELRVLPEEWEVVVRPVEVAEKIKQ
ncbi:MAG TPA: hypothetical protein P5028_01430 [Candidatus Marinimicrobia bacterium]|nr:hypothetical protein [Candidatus Neomarinimicrobiota bacterium]HRS90693.1 hypothetical protein [Candidatus Neomarinimicrobiota bacterium]HRU93404.1 hypothetical protein [Candidatus Neomarinimicrobiota bacterium]